MNPPKYILPTIVIAQFLCTSLWFAGNGVLVQLIAEYNLGTNSLGNITSAVQLGFILGTFLFALLTLTDRFSPSKVFLWSAVFGAVSNLGIVLDGIGWSTILASRFLTGFFLAGIYPVGMKIAADYYAKGLGKSLGYLVGALVVGTALPHLLKSWAAIFPWQYVIFSISLLSVIGGLLMFLLVPNGPYRKPSKRFDLTACFEVFKKPDFKAAAFGYFGHMWELYTFWAFVPFLLALHMELNHINILPVSLWSFWIIAIGGLACVLGGYVSLQKGTKTTAAIALGLSGLCSLLSPFFLSYASTPIFIVYLLFWGMMVIADSPLFSTMVAQNASPEIQGTALTIVNCIGFAITILSLQFLNYLQDVIPHKFLFMVLALGPAVGLWNLFKKQS